MLLRRAIQLHLDKSYQTYNWIIRDQIPTQIPDQLQIKREVLKEQSTQVISQRLLIKVYLALVNSMVLDNPQVGSILLDPIYKMPKYQKAMIIQESWRIKFNKRIITFKKIDIAITITTMY
jgi:hypothetical protein